MKTIIATILLVATSSSASAATQADAESGQCTVQRFEPLLASAIEAKSAYDALAKAPPKQRADTAMAAADLASAKADLAAALDECGLSLPAAQDSALAPP